VSETGQAPGLRTPLSGKNPQGRSFGTARAEPMSSFKGRQTMARIESYAFAFIAVFAGILTLVTVAPIA
jgi:hypothetical protein